MDYLFESLQNKFIENIDQENKQKIIIDLLNSQYSLFITLLPDCMLQEFVSLPEESLLQFIKLCAPLTDGYSNIFIGKVLNLICDRIIDANDTNKFKMELILQINVKHMTLDVCKKYLQVYPINIAYIAEHHDDGEMIYNEYMTDDNASEEIKKFFSKFEKDKQVDHLINFFEILNPSMFRHVIKHVTSIATDKYNLQGVLISEHLTLDDVQLITKVQKSKISKKLFETQVPPNIIKRLNNVFLNWLAEGDKIKFSEQNLIYLIDISTNAFFKDRVLKLLNIMEIEMFDTTNFVHTKQIINNVLQHLKLEELLTFRSDLLNKPEILEIYKQHVPPLVYIAKMPNNYSLQDLCEAILNTKLNEKNHKHTFDHIYFPTIAEQYINETDLQVCLKNVTVPLRKIIVEQIVDQYKKLTKQTLLKFNNIYPIIVKKIYSKFLSSRFSQLIVAKIDMSTITLSNEEILDMCLIKEDYECGICYLHQINVACKTCGHGICSICATGIKKTACAFCAEKYDYITLRS